MTDKLTDRKTDRQLDRQTDGWVLYPLRCEGAAQCDQRPKADADTHDDPAVVTVTQVAKDWSQDHVAADKH